MSSSTSRKHSILATATAIALSAGAFTTITFAAAAPAYEKQLAQAFPGGKIQEVGSREVNGVKVHEVRIETASGQADATVTDGGDILLATNPHKAGELPPDVAAVSEGLFGTAPTSVESFIVNNYIVNVTANGKGYELKIDGTGRVADIDTKQQAQYESPAKMAKASSGDTEKISKLVLVNFPGAKIKDVHVSPTSPGFYAVEFTTAEGKYGYVSINEDNRVRSFAIQINIADLPKPVQATIAEIKGAKVNGVLHYTTHYWELQESVNGDTLTMKVRPDGDIISVESAGAKQAFEAATASHKQAAAAAGKKPS